ncbi:MAG: sulfite exporter TauE/SafE family protein, partial [Bilophila sp.]
TPAFFAYVCTAVFLAGIVRGATGFGFSMIMIVLLTLVLPPAVAATVILMWEILASVGHLPFVYREVNWKALRWLALGVLVGTPAGVLFLVHMPIAPMKICINLTVLLLTIPLLRGMRPSKAPSCTATTAVGLLSGVINGASANGGPPVILFFLSGPGGVGVSRASLIAFFLFTDVWASLIYWQQGLVTWSTVRFAVLFLIPLALGIWVGSKCFTRMNEQVLRKIVLILLIAVTSVALLHSLI